MLGCEPLEYVQYLCELGGQADPGTVAQEPGPLGASTSENHNVQALVKFVPSNQHRLKDKPAASQTLCQTVPLHRRAKRHIVHSITSRKPSGDITHDIDFSVLSYEAVESQHDLPHDQEKLHVNMHTSPSEMVLFSFREKTRRSKKEVVR